MIELKGKTALVTGAGSGIGRAIAMELAAQGCNLVLSGRKMPSLEETAAACPGVKTLIIPADMEDYASLASLHSSVLQENVSIDIFVLNAGISQREKALETDFSVDEKILRTDFLGAVYLIKQFGPEIKASQHVQIAVTSSISGLFGFPLRSAYSAAKSALVGFFESLDLEYANVDVTLLFPGRINTRISRSALRGDGSAHGAMDAGQAGGMDALKCARIAVKAIRRQKHRKLIGGKELLMVHIHKWCLPLYFKLSGKISAT